MMCSFVPFLVIYGVINETDLFHLLPPKLICSLIFFIVGYLLDGDGRLMHEKSFRLCVYQNGLEPSLRAVVWRHLLNVYPKKDDVGMSGKERIAYTKRLAEKYYSLKKSWLNKFKLGYIHETLRLIANAVRKDVVRTDRTHEFYAGDDDQNQNVLSLFYLLVTYALTHPEIGYCQG